MSRLLDGAAKRSGQPVESGFIHPWGRNDHVIHSWLQFDSLRRSPQTSLDSVSLHRRPASPGHDEPETWGPGLPWRADQDDLTAATTNPVGEDSTKVSRVAKGLVVRQRVASGPFGDDSLSSPVQHGFASGRENRDDAFYGELWVDRSSSWVIHWGRGGNQHRIRVTRLLRNMMVGGLLANARKTKRWRLGRASTLTHVPAGRIAARTEAGPPTATAPIPQQQRKREVNALLGEPDVVWQATARRRPVIGLREETRQCAKNQFGRFGHRLATAKGTHHLEKIGSSSTNRCGYVASVHPQR